MSLTGFARKTADWTPDSFDPSPLLMLTCTLIQHNRSQSRDLLTYTETFARAALARFTISSASITRLFKITSSLYRKTDRPDQGLSSNHISLAILELLNDGLQGKARMSALTLKAILEAITPDPGKDMPIYLLPDSCLRLADSGMSYLQSEASDNTAYLDFSAAQAVSKWVFYVSEDHPQALSRLMSSRIPLRTWNLVLLSALLSSSKKPTVSLLAYFPSFTLVYYRTLSSFQRPEQHSQDAGHVEVSRAYMSMKLWLLACRKATQQDDVVRLQTGGYEKESATSLMIWNELWPPYERVIAALESDTQAGNLSALTATISSCAADLMLFLRQSRCVVALETAAVVVLLDRLRAFGRGEAKLSRVLRSLNDAPPDVPLNYFITQAKTEIWAEEKLDAARRQEMLKVIPDRSRRIVS